MNKSKYLYIILFPIAVLSLYLFTKTGCIVKEITGLPCPSCGMTRAWLSFIKFDFISAFKWHPLFLLGPVFIYLIFSHFKKKNLYLTLFSILFIAVYIIRMSAMFPTQPPMDIEVNNKLFNILGLIFP